MNATPPDLSRLRIERNDPPPRSARRGLWGLAAAALVVVIAAAAFLLRPQPTPVQVASVAAGGGAGGEGISANGYVVARTQASVSAQIMARLVDLRVHEGSHVRKGEIIARLESSDAEAALNAARANFANLEAQLVQARRDLGRARSLAQQQVLSPADLESAETKADVLAAQANAARAQTRLAEVGVENTRVRAPFDGTVLTKDAEVGEVVAPTSAGGGLTRTAIVTMADLATLEVEVDVNEAYIAQIHSGQPARITLDAYPDTTFVGRVRQVVPTADRQKATVLVKVSILDRDPRILPEMGAKVVFAPPAGGAAALPRWVTVPAAAVVRDASGARVWVVDNGRATARAVTLGADRGTGLEVRGGLAGGETVVLHPPAGLKDGARVRATPS